MNLNKHLEYIQPTAYSRQLHIIGVGAIGSRLAELLVRLGFDDLVIYDFDTVEDVNITNQLYTFNDIGKSKTEALIAHLKEINPLLTIRAEGLYENQRLSGTVFLSVDSIETRRRIVQANMYNMYIDLFCDVRMRLSDAQAYAADWHLIEDRQRFIGTMSFDDKDDLTPVSVCGTTLSVATTVMTICSMQINNFIHYVKKMPIKHIIEVDLSQFAIGALSFPPQS